MTSASAWLEPPAVATATWARTRRGKGRSSSCCSLEIGILPPAFARVHLTSSAQEGSTKSAACPRVLPGTTAGEAPTAGMTRSLSISSPRRGRTATPPRGAPRRPRRKTAATGRRAPESLHGRLGAGLAQQVRDEVVHERKKMSSQAVSVQKTPRFTTSLASSFTTWAARRIPPCREVPLGRTRRRWTASSTPVAPPQAPGRHTRQRRMGSTRRRMRPAPPSA